MMLSITDVINDNQRGTTATPSGAAVHYSGPLITEMEGNHTTKVRGRN